MKSHATKEECFDYLSLPKSVRAVFYMGWYAAGNQINNGLDSDDVHEQLEENDFLGHAKLEENE
jgi:hypothetical protein